MNAKHHSLLAAFLCLAFSGPLSVAAINDGQERWQVASSVGAPAPRAYPAAVWTGREMIVWGGYHFGAVDTGARYDPVADLWTPLPANGAPSPRYSGPASWPVVWTGHEMIIWGGSDGAMPLATGARFNTNSNTWIPISTNGAPEARGWQVAVWTGTEMLVWGGYQNGRALNTGGRYDPATDTWTTMPTNGAPSPRTSHSAIWTGTEMIVWGGGNESEVVNTGSRYNPTLNSWSPISVANAPTARWTHGAVWTGTEMLVWGGRTFDNVAFNTGGRYNPASDTWEPISTTGAPAGRWGTTPVWTGREMLVWGGATGWGTLTDTGGRYNPAADKWTNITMTGAPSVRWEHNAVWTGESMICFGGGDYTGYPTGTFLYFPPRSCAPAPAGLVGWWKGDGNASDNVGTNHGTLRNGASFTNGMVGEAFFLDGQDDFILISNSPSLRIGGAFTVEFWFNPAVSITPADPASHVFFSKGDDDSIGTANDDGRVELRGPAPRLVSVNSNWLANTWHHLALTYSAGAYVLFIDGQSQANTVSARSILDNDADIHLGDLPILGAHFHGAVDELRIYNRALSSGEIAAIHSAGGAGLCESSIVLCSNCSPAIVTQPASRTNLTGTTASFSVAATGSPPLAWQWRKDGADILRATNTTFSLMSAQTDDAGDYTVVVSNPFGVVTSAVARLTVEVPGPLDVWARRDTGSMADLYSIARRSGLFVAVGHAGAILTSTNGLDWMDRSISPSNELHAIAWSDVFVAVGKDGAILTSADGVIWTNQNSETVASLKSVIHAQGLHVIVGGGGTILTSTDTLNWTNQVSGVDETLNAITYADGLFVAVGDGKRTNGVIVVSTNGLEWIGASSGTGKNLRGVTHGDGLFVAVGNDGTILTSRDGTIWTNTPVAYPCSAEVNLRGITFANGTFVAVGNEGIILTSVDGTAWTCRASGTVENLHGVAFGEERFVAVGNAGTIVINNPPPIIQIGIEQPMGTTLASGSNRNFGEITLGRESALTFIVRNLGNTNLTGLSVTITGPDAAMFTAVTNAGATVRPGQSISFIIRFRPTSFGNKSASLQISSNDPDENPFIVSLTGACLPVVEAWVRRHDTSGYGSGAAVAIDASANVIVTGTSATIKYLTNGTIAWTNIGGIALAVDGRGDVLMTGPIEGSGEPDYYTAKYAALDGALLWQQRYSGSRLYNGSAMGIALDSKGDVVVTGISGTVKYAGADGTFLWQARAGNAVVVDSHGDVILTGQSGTFSDYDYHTLKLVGTNGAALWVTTYNGSVGGTRNPQDVPQAVAVDRDGNAVVTGYSSNGSNDDWYTAKYAAANGALLWERRHNGPGNRDDYARSVAVDSNGNVVVAGSSKISTFDDFLTIKYRGTDGAELWQNRHSTGEAMAVATDTSGNVTVTGFSRAIGGSQRYYTAKYAAANGTLLWEKTYTGPEGGPDFAWALAIGPRGMVAVTGDDATVVYRDSFAPPSPLSVLSIFRNANGPRVRLSGAFGDTFEIQRTTNFTGPWINLETITIPAPGFIELNDTNAPPGQAFYRAVSQ